MPQSIHWFLKFEAIGTLSCGESPQHSISYPTPWTLFKDRPKPFESSKRPFTVPEHTQRPRLLRQKRAPKGPNLTRKVVGKKQSQRPSSFRAGFESNTRRRRRRRRVLQFEIRFEIRFERERPDTKSRNTCRGTAQPRAHRRGASFVAPAGGLIA